MSQRVIAHLSALAGLAVLVGLVVYAGAPDVLAGLATGGWGLLWLVPLHLVREVCNAIAWRALLRFRIPDELPPLTVLTWISAVRGSVNELLPVARIGGQVVGIRLLVLHGVGRAIAAASVLVQVTLLLFAQCLYILAGVALLGYGTGVTALGHGVLAGVAAVLLVLAALLLLQRYGQPFARLRALVVRLGASHKRLSTAVGAQCLDGEVEHLYTAPRSWVPALLWQLAGLGVQAAEVWLAMTLIGHPVTVAEAFMLESLNRALRSVGFFVPANLGVQEAGYVVVGHVLGLSSDVALALALAERLRMLGFGVPFLLSWQLTEGRRLRARHRPNEG